MDIFQATINQMVQNIPSSHNDGDYQGDDGLIYCGKCKTPKQTWVFNRAMPCVCDCKKEELEQKKIKQEQLEKQEKIKRLKKLSLIGEKYKNVTFENTETSHSIEFKKIFDRCRKYCEVSNEVLKQGTGIYLFGTKGTGKSRLTACMSNELTSKFHSVLYTNFAEISKHIRATFGSATEQEYQFIERLASIDFLFIDDFGTEQVTRNNQDNWLQEKVFEIINKRYNNNKPIIFTSNYSLEELIRDRGMADKTVDRIVEVCEIMKLEGKSYRLNMMKQREKIF